MPCGPATWISSGSTEPSSGNDCQAGPGQKPGPDSPGFWGAFTSQPESPISLHIILIFISYLAMSAEGICTLPPHISALAYSN
jgi:hypothetical protein